MEYWVVTFLANSELTILLVRLLVVVGGFIIALALHLESTTRLERSPFVFIVGLLSLLLVVPSALWLFESQLFLNHLLWAVQLGDFIVLFLVGYVLGLLSIWRARDAFGVNALALLSLVPVVQALLFIKDSNTNVPGRQPLVMDLFSGWGGPALGVGFIGLAGFLFVWVDDQYVPDAGVTRAITFARIQNYGLEGTLAMMASEADTPLELEDFSTLVAVEAQQTMLSYRYVTEYQNTVYLTEPHKALLRAYYCNEMPFTILLTQGATFEDAYLGADGTIRESHVVTADMCQPETGGA